MKHPFWSDQQLAQFWLEHGQERFIAEKMWERGTGKTTAAILRALLQATENPHEWVLVDSPDDYSTAARRDRLATETLRMSKELPHTRVAVRTAEAQWPANTPQLIRPLTCYMPRVYVKFGGE